MNDVQNKKIIYVVAEKIMINYFMRILLNKRDLKDK